MVPVSRAWLANQNICDNQALGREGRRAVTTRVNMNRHFDIGLKVVARHTLFSRVSFANIYGGHVAAGYP